MMLKVRKLRCTLKKYMDSNQHLCFQHSQPKPILRPSLNSNEVEPIFRKAATFNNKIALRDLIGSYTYANLFFAAKELSSEITKYKIRGINEQILFLSPNNANYVITQWAIWMSGHTAVPMSSSHPESMLEYYANDSDSKLLITTSEHVDIMHKVSKTLSKPLLVVDDKLRESCLLKAAKGRDDFEDGLPINFYYQKNSMVLYTSGTTGKPKGVVLTHKNIISQIKCLVDAWKWTSKDIILHVLPLQHVHGIVNALLCPLYVGAKCIMLPKYDSNIVWSYLLGLQNTLDDRRINVFMAVPTIYAKLIEEYDKVFTKEVKMMEHIKTTLQNKIRLMVCGSAPLTVPIYERWLEITGHRLLQRYGMTEIGMCLSQELDSERDPHFVGVPLPGVTVRLGQKPEEDEGDYTMILESSNLGKVDINVNSSLTLKDDPIGELLVKGDSVFKEYFNKPIITQNEFTTGNWFKTGDMCQYSLTKKLFKILGRTSVDIIKTGGHKVSALEIERQLLGHPNICECAVVGLKDDTWGEIVGAIVVLKLNEEQLTTDALKEWASKIMSDYSIPRALKIVDAIPKNAMGKINKKQLVSFLFP